MIATLFFTVLLAVPAAHVDVSTVDGTEMRGELNSWTSAEITLVSEGKTAKFNAEQLLQVRWPQPSSSEELPAGRVQFVDGTQLPLDEYEVADRQATIKTPLSKRPLKMATSQIRWVQFSARATEAEKLRKILAEKPSTGDMLVIQKPKTGAIDSLTGVVGDVSSSQVRFRWEGEDIPVKRSKVAALAYYHLRLPEFPAAICWLTTRDGARLPVSRLELEQDRLHVTSVAGLELLMPIDALAEADYSVGKLTYLSDLQPMRQQWIPRIELPTSATLIRQYGAPRSNQSFTGSALTLRWPAGPADVGDEVKTYAKGLALRSRTELEYRLPRDMRRFAAIAGIDPATAREGNVLLEISADGRQVWQGEVDGKTAPVNIDVDIQGARQLKILVDYGANLDTGDRLHLVEARVTK